MTGIIAAAGITAAAGLGSGLMQMGKGSGGTQTQMQQSMIPGGIEQRDTDNYRLLVEALNNMPGPYTGQRVTGLSPETQNLVGQLYGNVGSTNPYFQNALAGTQGLMGYQGQQISPQLLANANLNPYMNPYTQSVINPSMQLLEQQRQQGLNQIAAQARQTGAFGGSRQGVQEGVTNAQSNLLAGQLGANLWGQNFAQAQAAATGDITRNLQAQQSNQQYDFLAAQLRGQMANQYGNQAAQMQNNWLTGVTAAMGGQDVLRQNQQDQLNAQKALYDEQRMDPVQRIQMRMQAVTQSPYSRMTSTTGPGPSTDPWMTGLGTASTVAGLMGSFGKMGLFGSGSTGTAGTTMYPTGMGGYDMYGTGAFGLGASDRRLKTDIRKMGHDPETDLDVYAYRYKGDPKTYPKAIGPMAQDVQKKFPDQVVKVGDYLAVNRNFLMGVAQRAV